MRQMIPRREFFGKAASVAIAPLMLGRGAGTPNASNDYLSAGIPSEVFKMIQIGEKYQAPTFSKEEYKRRWQTLQRSMEAKKADCLMILDPHDLRYVANLFGGRDEDDYPCLITLKSEPSLFIPWPEVYYYIVEISPIPEIVNADNSSMMEAAKKIKQLGLEKGTIGIDSLDGIRYKSYALLQRELPEAKFVEASDIVLECWQIKSEAEIELFRKSQEIGEKAFRAMTQTAKAGVTDREVMGAALGALISAGADMDTRIMHNISHWPEPSPYSARNFALSHPYYMGGTERKLQKGDIIGFELYSSYGGYTSDVCLPISIGEPHPDYVMRFEICKEMVRIGQGLLRPGHTQADIDSKLTEYLSSQLKTKTTAITDYKNFCPIPNRGDRTLKSIRPGMVIAITPVTIWNGGPNHLCAETFVTTQEEPQRIGNLPLEIAVV